MHETVELAACVLPIYADLGDLLNNDLHKLEEGQDLSGGQKQRINMARGFAAKMHHIYC